MQHSPKNEKTKNHRKIGPKTDPPYVEDPRYPKKQDKEAENVVVDESEEEEDNDLVDNAEDSEDSDNEADSQTNIEEVKVSLTTTWDLA